MGKIVILDSHVINRIAAGEVIERPYSVVKELIENSIDANATSVTIEVKKGGTELIRVVDNGVGISEDDIENALKRHATSKIKSEKDLLSIYSFGFRGEALPSIASVSKFKIASKAQGEDAGTVIVSHGGEIVERKPYAMPFGTEIEVKEIFFNVPVRKKFLKSPRTELSHIIETVKRFAIPFYDVEFKLISDGKLILHYSREKDISARMLSVFGKKIFKNLIFFQNNTLFPLKGFTSIPEFERKSGSDIYIYINNRFVRDKIIKSAIIAGYGNMLDRGKYPFSVIFFSPPPDFVDVNVHPAKFEVRFQEPSLVYQLIKKSVENALKSANWLGGDERKKDRAKQSQSDISETGANSSGYFYKVSKSMAPSQLKSTFFSYNASETAESDKEEIFEISFGPREGFFSSLKYLGQLKELFLLCESETGLVIIDHHAAHERVVFEKLKKDFFSNEIPVQELLFPAKIEIRDELLPVIEENKELIEKLGFSIREFGGNTYVVESVPDILKTDNLEEIFTELLNELKLTRDFRDFVSRIEHILSGVACKSSIRHGKKMTEHEVQSLFSSLDEIDFSGNCPHGRPIVVSFTTEEIYQWFKRR